MWKMNIQDNIIYEDRDILVCRKPAGFAVQSAGVGTMDMESALKNYLALKNLGRRPGWGSSTGWISLWKACWCSPLRRKPQPA